MVLLERQERLWLFLMKYLVNGSYKNDPLLKLILGFSLIFIIGLWISNALLYIDKIGLSYRAVIDYYRGDGEFSNPLSYQGLLEVTHAHLFVFGFYLLLINHLMLFTGIPDSIKLILILISFISGMGNLSAGWLVRFLSPSFAYLKISSFCIFQISTALIIIFSFFSFKNGACAKDNS